MKIKHWFVIAVTFCLIAEESRRFRRRNIPPARFM